MQSRPALRVVRSAPAVDVFELAGEHDMASAPQLEMALKQSLGEGRGIVADLSEVRFIDSSVIHVLFDTDSALAGQGKQLVLQINTASIVMRAPDQRAHNPALHAGAGNSNRQRRNSTGGA
jgi:anti-anti-sigma factor